MHDSNYHGVVNIGVELKSLTEDGNKLVYVRIIVMLQRQIVILIILERDLPMSSNSPLVSTVAVRFPVLSIMSL